MNGNFMDRFRALDCNHCWNTLVELSQLRPKTADANRRQIMDKLRIYNIAELTKYAIREGLTTTEF